VQKRNHKLNSRVYTLAGGKPECCGCAKHSPSLLWNGDPGATANALSGTHVGVGRLGRRDFVALRTGHVEDDCCGLGVFLFGDGGEGAEELVGDVGEDGGAAGGDFVLREEEEQAGGNRLFGRRR
jgi:hypothetical protein